MEPINSMMETDMYVVEIIDNLLETYVFYSRTNGLSFLYAF